MNLSFFRPTPAPLRVRNLRELGLSGSAITYAFGRFLVREYGDSASTFADLLVKVVQEEMRASAASRSRSDTTPGDPS